MATATAAATKSTTKSTPKAKLSRATLKAQGRKKRKLKVQTDKAFAKALFEGKAKRAADRKSAFRKKKKGKK